MNSTASDEISTGWKQKFLLAFYRTVQTIRLYQDNNKLVRQCVAQFKEASGKLFDEDEELPIAVSRGRLYILSEKMGYRHGSIKIIHDFIDFFTERKLQGIVLHEDLKEASFEQILFFIRALTASVDRESPPEFLIEQMENAGIRWVETYGDASTKPSKRISFTGDAARRAYLHAHASIREVVRKLSLRGEAGVRKAKRMVQTLIELIKEDEALMVGLSTIHDYDDYTYTHSVNVAILSMCLGNRIGLSNVSLTHLGICGLFHDLGKVEVPREILNKPGKLTDEEWAKMRDHPFSSVRQILKLGASYSLKSKILLAPFEHHVNADLSGYPITPSKHKVSLFGSILHIADFYDAVTSPRIYRSYPFSPDRAIGMMTAGAGKEFDPLLLKVFIAMLGAYPIGTLLRLHTGEWGLVMDYAGASCLPRVVLLEEDPKEGFVRGEVADLGDVDSRNGAFRRKIAGSIHPGAKGIQPVKYLI